MYSLYVGKLTKKIENNLASDSRVLLSGLRDDEHQLIHSFYSSDSLLRIRKSFILAQSLQHVKQEVFTLFALRSQILAHRYTNRAQATICACLLA